MFSLGNPTIYSPDGIAMGSMFPAQTGGAQNKPVFEPFADDDIGDRASRTIIENLGNPMERSGGFGSVEDEIRKPTDMQDTQAIASFQTQLGAAFASKSAYINERCCS